MADQDGGAIDGARPRAVGVGISLARAASDFRRQVEIGDRRHPAHAAAQSHRRIAARAGISDLKRERCAHGPISRAGVSRSRKPDVLSDPCRSRR